MTSFVLDKNKATHKLKGIPHIYWINLDDKTDRREYMERQFEYWEIENHTRISAYDGREDDLSDILTGRYPHNMSSGEIGCVTSHLHAMKHWLETSDEEYAIMMEDDCDLSVTSHWPFTWKDVIANAPHGWDCIQLAIINPAIASIQLHRRFVNDFSTACYLINRRYAKKLLDFHTKGDKYKLDQKVLPRAVADDLIYNTGLTYSVPIFLYKLDLGSDIHDIHIDVYHRNCHDGLWQFWRNEVNQVENPVQIVQLNPYFGTLPPGFEGK
mgnify:FL=1|tara:strand:- start:2994 stop:3800 length:807 start_codon:yes stop_codon:yes gene_type:complete